MQQVCALPYRRIDGTIEFCLITTRRKARWSFPKGTVDRGESLGEAAARETLEEAGVEGVVRGEPLGEFTNSRYTPPRTVTAFLMEVTRIHDQWLEDSERQRCWCEVDEALGRLEFEPLRDLVQRAMERLKKET
jgi:8-oxo-dGTP pyrophosphatase MutT (NUDIX family)